MRINRVKLIALMAEKNLRVNDVVEITGIARATISAVRSGKSCTYETAAKIAKALKVDVTELIQES